MHLVAASVSIFALGFILRANGCQKTATRADGSVVTFSCGKPLPKLHSTPTGTTTPTNQSSIPTGGPHTPHDIPDACFATITKSGIATVINTCNLFESVSKTVAVTVAPEQTAISPHQLNVACWTTLTKDGQAVVVNCGNGFLSGHSPTPTTPTVTTVPSTICIEDRCFDIIGTFGSATSTTAVPTPTPPKREL